MLPARIGRKPSSPNLVDEVHQDAGLVAGHVGQDNARRVGLGLEDGPERRVELGIDEDEVLASRDRRD